MQAEPYGTWQAHSRIHETKATQNKLKQCANKTGSKYTVNSRHGKQSSI